jgi:hypothetical protein
MLNNNAIRSLKHYIPMDLMNSNEGHGKNTLKVIPSGLNIHQYKIKYKNIKHYRKTNYIIHIFHNMNLNVET